MKLLLATYNYPPESFGGSEVYLEALAAELTNHVIPSAIVTPGAVGTLPELQQVGFHYAK